MEVWNINKVSKSDFFYIKLAINFWSFSVKSTNTFIDQRNINEEKEQQTNKRFIDLNHSKDGRKISNKRTKRVGITFCKEFNIYNFIGVEEAGKAKGAAMFSWR